MSISFRVALCFAFLAILASSYLLDDGRAYPTGWSGATGDPDGFGFGCTCHNQQPSEQTTVTIGTSATAFEPGKTYEFVVSTSNPAQVAAGVDVSAFAGVLDTVRGEGLQPDQNGLGELVHSRPKPLINGRTSWRFLYTAPIDKESDTIYAVSNAVNGNGGVDEGDLWNAAPKYVLAIGNTASVNKGSATARCRIMPNPASDRIEIISDKLSAGSYRLRLNDLSGRAFFTQEIKVSGLLDHQVDVRSIPSGVYSLSLLSDGRAAFTSLINIRR
jgi:hypothetical protein